jgi:hypothetical protein
MQVPEKKQESNNKIFRLNGLLPGRELRNSQKKNRNASYRFATPVVSLVCIQFADMYIYENY